MRSIVCLCICACALTACGGSGGDARVGHDLDDAARVDAEAPIDGGDARDDGAPLDAPDAHALTAAHYVSRVVSFTKGDGGGYGQDKMPTVVEGPPHGGGCCAGSTDVLSLGDGGEIVVAFDVEIVDGPGVDLLVFENPFEIGGDKTNILAELGEVSVSEDGVSWSTFPCTAREYPYGACAGWHPVYATPDDPVDVDHPEKAGGDPFDLADLGVTRAKFVRVRDMRTKIPSISATAGFDLDAMAVIHTGS